MSIEALLKDLTAAIEANTAALIGARAASKPVERPVLPLNTTAQDEALAAAVKKAEAAAKVEAETKAAPPVDFPTLKKAFLALVAKNEPAALEILKKHKLEKPNTPEKIAEGGPATRPALTGAKPEQFAAVLADINKALA